MVHDLFFLFQSPLISHHSQHHYHWGGHTYRRYAGFAAIQHHPPLAGSYLFMASTMKLVSSGGAHVSTVMTTLFRSDHSSKIRGRVMASTVTNAIAKTETSTACTEIWTIRPSILHSVPCENPFPPVLIL